MPTLKLGYDKINGIPFHEAIKAAQQRDVVLPDVYYGDLQGLARQLAFSVAGIAALDQLENVKNSLSAALQRGESQQKWTKEILESGVLDLPDYRLDNIFRTNIQNSYNRGRWERFQRTKATRPYLMYDAINDSRVRPNHLAMDGVIRPVDDPIWDTWMPSNGYRCFLPGTRVRGDFKIGLKSFYSGPAIEIVSSDGSRLSVTANHPILTARGWIKACDVDKTDYLLSNSSGVNAFLPGVVNNKQKPARVEDVFKSLSAQAMGICSISSFDFHDDIKFRKGDVYVAGSDCILMNGFKPLLNNCVNNGEFIDATNRIRFRFPHDALRLPYFCFVVFNSVFSKNSRDIATRCIENLSKLAFAARNIFIHFKHRFFKFVVYAVSRFPCCLALSFDTARRGLNFFPFKFFCVRPSPDVDVIDFKNTSDCSPGNIKKFGNRFFAISRCVSFANIAIVKLNSRLSSIPFFKRISFLSGSSFNSGISKQSTKEAITDSVIFEQIRNICAGDVSINNVVSVRNFSFSGHVYDFETETGLIVAENIITHNCRCRLISLSEKQALARSGQGKGINKPIPGDVQPDKGWDYNPGADLTVGVKRALDSRENDVLMAVLSQKIDDFENNDQPKTIDDFIKYGADITKTMSDGASNPLLLHQQIIDRLRNEIGTDSPCITESKGEGAKLAKLASQIFPDSWTKKTDELGNFYTKAKATTRGHCTTFDDKYDAFVGRKTKLHDFGIVEIEKGAGYMMVRKGDIGNAVHEYTHRMQAAMPELDQLFQDMHNRRTKNDPLEKLKDIYPGSGYKITEVTRKDKYINAYQGKEYDGEPLEVMTMAMEYILGVTEGHWLSNNRQENFKRFYEQDRELFDFTVGVLFGWAPS